MRAFRFLSLMILATFLGASALLYAQDEKQQDDKTRQDEPKARQDEPKRQDAEKPGHQDETKPAKQEKQDEKQMKKQEQERSQGQPAHPEHEQQAGKAHPAGKGGHIPDDKFRAHFGRGHTFKAQTVIVSGQPQFQYSGYTFELVDVWPVGWAYTDECYIDYIDGEYFLFDLLHPGIRVVVFVVF